MQYEVAAWSGDQEARNPMFRHGLYSVVAKGAFSKGATTFSAVHHYAVVPAQGADAASSERAELLAQKISAFLNEYDEKSQQVLELMKIAGSG